MPYIGNTIRAADDYRLIDDISSGFNGSTTSFALQVAGSAPVPFPKSPQQILISVNGVIQEPDPTGASGFNLVGTNIVFSSAPTNGHAFFGIIYATADYLNAGGNFPAGSLGAPSITFIGDENTGLFRKSGGSVGFVSDATEIANFDSNGITISSGSLVIADSIIHSGDTNTKIRFSNTDQIKLETGGVQRLKIDGTESVFNDDGESVDFRVEGDGDTNLFFVDASTDRIGIGTNLSNTPSSILTVKPLNSSSGRNISLYTSGSVGNKAGIFFNQTQGSGNLAEIQAEVESGTNKGSLHFSTSLATRLSIDENGQVGIGTSSPGEDLHISADTPVIRLTDSSTSRNAQFVCIDGSLRLDADNDNQQSNTNIAFRTDGTERMRLNGANLGIGTTSPSQKLDVAGGIKATTDITLASTTSGQSIFVTKDGTESVKIGHIGTGNEGFIALKDGGTDTVVLHGDAPSGVSYFNAGNVGIGTTSPTRQLDINNSSHATLALTSSTQSSLFFADDDTNIGQISYNHASNYMYFRVNDAERVRIDSSGSLLIGGTSSIGSNYPLQVYHATDARMYLANTTAASSQDVNLQFAPANSVTGASITCTSEEDFSTSANRTARLAFNTRKDGTLEERMRIDSSGNVGIGTTSPDGKLSVTGNIVCNSGTVRSNSGFSSDTDLILNADENDNGSNSIIFKESGTERARFKTDGDLLLTRQTGGGGGDETLLISGNYGSGSSQALVASAAFRIYSGGTNERLRIKSTGEVGIGTTSPDAQLEVSSSSFSTEIKISTSDQQDAVGNVHGQLVFEGRNQAGTVYESAQIRSICESSIGTRRAGLGFLTSGSTPGVLTEKLRITNDGKVGINTSDPQAKLQANDTNPVVAEFYRSDGGDNDEARIALGALSTNIPSQRGVQLAAVNNSAGHDFSIRTSSSHSAGPTEKMKVTSGGIIFLSTNTNTSGGGSATWYVSGSQQQIFRGNAGDYIHFKTTSGTGIGRITNIGDSSTNYNTSSDYRLKENQTAISDGITRLKTLKPYRFNWKSDSSRIVDGFFAHEVTAVPEAISGTKDKIAVQADVDEGLAINLGDPVYQSIDHSKLVPLLTAALQEAITKIETLETKVAALEAA